MTDEGPVVGDRAVDAVPAPDALDERFADTGTDGGYGLTLSFRTRLTIGLVAASLIPLAGFGTIVIILGTPNQSATLGRLLLFVLVVAAMIGILLAWLLAADLTAPLRAIAAAVDRASAGDLSTPIVVPGDDELARLADSHNRLAADLERRNRELGRILEAIERGTPRDGQDFIAGRAGADARSAFGMIDAAVLLVDPGQIAAEERIPGESLPVRAVLRLGNEEIGVLVGHLPATRLWERADQDLLELFASEVAIAIRNAQLFAQVESQNAQLLELDAAKDDFLRGVSHNLQTPLTSIRAYADQLGRDRPDRRLGIIAEQTDRLSRMVRQLLTVTRLESGALKPRPEVVALAHPVRRAWEALAADDVAFRIDDRSAGWLAVADIDQLDQVLWALLDNALKYGERTPILVEIAPVPEQVRLRLTVSDLGPGVAESDRGRLFRRFERGADRTANDGSGLGLYVSRELCLAMGGDLVLEPPVAGRGASLSIHLPGEPPEEP
ncbi:MAG: two-component system, sensor histidine kinase and response regulator [Chloroflexota bacterium]|jgi:signal transduction histidine kinase|nr:two-component system, sensor histidine kinase and response regulator [Chloroflexota bacterium]